MIAGMKCGVDSAPYTAREVLLDSHCLRRASQPGAVDKERLHYPLHIIPRPAEWNGLGPVDDIDTRQAWIAVGAGPGIDLVRTRIVGRRRQNIGAAELADPSRLG
jgi:hypothetical protein